MSSTMGSGHGYDDGPEVAPQSYPEVAHHPQPQAYPLHQYSQQGSHPALKPEGYPHNSPYTDNAMPAGTSTYPPSAGFPGQPLNEATTKKSSKGVICGCSLLVFILSCIIGLLSAAVIGLAAGTGVEANRASNAETKLAALSSSIASATPTTDPTKTSSGTSSPTATAFNDLDRACSKDPEGITGTTYSSSEYLGGITFTIFCNKDAPGNPYLSLFTSDFDTCMDACAAYSKYMPNTFSNSNATTCGGVSFIPLWTVKANATEGQAPGNCYLKPAPQTATGLNTGTIGTEVHAAILRGG